MGACAIRTGVGEPAPGEAASAIVVVSAHFLSQRLCWGAGGWSRGGQVGRRLRADLECPRRLKSTDNHRVGVVRAARTGVIFREAVLASRDHARPAGKRLIVEPRIRGGPIQVLPCQHLAAILAVVCHPCGTLEAVGRIQDCRLVGPQLRRLLGEARY